MDMKLVKPALRVTVFSDYICPFCYVGDARLNRLRDGFDLKVNWCFLELHPDTSPRGESVASLNYPAQTWERMLARLREMAKEENLAFLNQDFTTNSRSALLLAEAAKSVDPGVFYRLHTRLFQAYFLEGENIGDRDCLRGLGREAGLSAEQIELSWRDVAVAARLRQYRMAARELRVQATPTFFIGEQRLDGAVPVEQLLQAAEAAA